MKFLNKDKYEEMVSSPEAYRVVFITTNDAVSMHGTTHFYVELNENEYATLSIKDISRLIQEKIGKGLSSISISYWKKTDAPSMSLITDKDPLENKL